MNENSAGVRPEIIALDILIKQTIEQGGACSASRLYSDNRFASFPAVIIQDPVLEPVDKLVWMAIRLQKNEGGSHAIFPTFDRIAKMANVSSTATVSRAINILRLTRWLTLYTNYTRGRFADDCGSGIQKNIYVLHDEAISLTDTVYLDPGYQSFMHESSEHHHARVKSVARVLLDAVDEDRELDDEVRTEAQPIENEKQGSSQVEKKVIRRYFSYSGRFIKELRNQPDKNPSANRRQKFKEDENWAQNLRATTSSMNNNCPQNLNPQDLNPQNLRAVRKEALLIYPRRLSEEQRKAADHFLDSLSVNQRQPVLDEMEGRIRAEQQGMTPLYDELSYLNTLCKALKKGTFKYNLGIKVHAEREARKRAEKKKMLVPEEQEDSQKLAKLRREIKAGGGPLADIRKILRMPNTTRTEV